MGRYSEAEEALTEALRLYAELGDRHAQIFAAHAMGQLRLTEERLPEASEQLLQVLEDYHDIGSKAGMGSALYDLGQCFVSLGQVRQAQTFLARSLKLRLQLHNVADQCESVGALMQLFERSEDIERAARLAGHLSRLAAGLSPEYLRRLGARELLANPAIVLRPDLFAEGQGGTHDDLVALAAESLPI